MKLLMTVSGLGLFLLGAFATWSFWLLRSMKRRRRQMRTAACAEVLATR